jgi:hypothetical protein
MTPVNRIFLRVSYFLNLTHLPSHFPFILHLCPYFLLSIPFPLNFCPRRLLGFITMLEGYGCSGCGSDRDRRFGGIYHHRLQVRRIRQARSQRETQEENWAKPKPGYETEQKPAAFWLPTPSCGFLASFLRSWRWRRYGPPKYRWASIDMGARGSAFGWGTMLKKVAGSIPDEVIGFLNWPNPSSRNMVLGSTQPLTEMSTRNLPGGKGRPARKADLTPICEPIV